MNVLKLILARGGSKGLINKNIKLLLNKPLIQYSIEAGKNSKYNKKFTFQQIVKKLLKFPVNLALKYHL